MDTLTAVPVLAALAQDTRLRAFRLLVQAGPDGVAAGALSEALGTPHNSLSFHLAHLVNAGIVSVRRQGRSMIYAVNFPAIRDLLEFLVKDCCSSDVARIRADRTQGCSIIELADCC